MTRPSSGSGSGGGPPGGNRPGSQLATPSPSAFIGRYQILDRIAEGGMGSLYLARDPAIDRLVAIKLLRRGFDTEALRERFAREARAAGRLRHSNVVTVFDVGEHDGDPFIAMEFLAGETLGELIRQGARLSVSRRLKLLEELCDGLAYAHRAGLVHRDIKPANLMVDAGGVLKILDFGIVRGAESGMTQAGVLVGTINYMSPEQVLGTGVDHRSDIFAVGLVAYELLSGRQAFAGTLKDGLLKRIPAAEVEALGDVVPGLDAEVVAIVEQALRKEPADRYQDLTRMRNDLTRARQRIEAEEERATAEAVAGAGETAFIAEDPTMPGVILQAPQASSPALLADAERAITEGNYRFALTMAGRAAAIDPQDRTPTLIVARAEAGLLEWGRAAESSGAGHAPSGSAAAPASPAMWEPAMGQVSNRGTLLAIGVAVVALIVAAVAVWPRLGPQTRDATVTRVPDQPPTAPAGEVPEVTPGSGAAGPGGPPAAEPEAADPPPVQVSANPPPDPSPRPASTDRRAAATPAPPPARPPAPRDNQRVVAPPPAGPVRVGSGVREPVRTHYVEPRYPASALAARAEGIVRVEVTIGRDGRVADARVVQSAGMLDEPALAAVRQWQFEPTTVDGQAVAVINTVSVPFALPAVLKPPAVVPGGTLPRPTAPSPAARPPDAPRETSPPRDLRAEAESAVRDVLRRYKDAWASLDFEAVRRVHALSGSEAQAVRATMRGASSYEMDIVVHAITIDSALRTASAECTITRRYDARIGSIQPQTTRQTLQFEKRGDAWLIVSIR